MVYWIIMALLLVVALGLIIAIVVTLKKNSRGQDEYEDEYEDGYEDEYDEEAYSERGRAYRNPQEVRETETGNRRGRSVPERRREGQPEPGQRKAGRQWKVILENLDTWEKSEFIFYENMGIGRSRSDGEFEKFLTVKEDPRVSKVHCAIVRKGDQLYLKDAGSRNGTYLNGHRLSQPVAVQRDDVIGIGETKIEIKKVLRERE